MNPEESRGIRRNPNPKKSYANTGIPVPQKFLRKIPVNAAENRNFQDPSKITFLGRSSSGNNREKKIHFNQICDHFLSSFMLA
jgi:hypothetical protein